MSGFKRANAERGYDVHELGRLSDVTKIPCPHSDSILEIWKSEIMDEDASPEYYSVGIVFSEFDPVHIVFSSSSGERTYSRAIDLVANGEITHPTGTSRLLTQWIDREIPTQWYKTCFGNHLWKCREQAFEESFRPRTTTYADWLIDVVDQCIVPASNMTRYITLSYTWGSVQCLKNTTASLKRLKKSGSLQNAQAPDIPRTVRDAMGITEYLGHRYLWVDSLCIIQDDGDSLSRNINAMHKIYADSSICLVAYAGTDANHGLRGFEGISAPRRVTQIALDIGGREMLSLFAKDSQIGTEPAGEGSTYNERGWTYQEFIFAKRRLIFTDGPLRWVCGSKQLGEETLVDLRRDGFTAWMPATFFMDLKLPSLDILNAIASDYNLRHFTHQRDVLGAFLGIQNHLHGIFDGGLNYGHPEMFLDISLAWAAVGEGTTRRSAPTDVSSDEDTPPSWSWMGWRGYISFPSDDEYQSQNDGPQDGFTEPVAQWSAMRYPPPILSNKRPVKCEWHHYRRIAEEYASLPDGWVRTVTDTGLPAYQVWPDTWKGAPQTNYPVPLPKSTTEIKPIEQLRFLSARTTRCHFASKAIVLPRLHRSHGPTERRLELCSVKGEFVGFLETHHISDINRFITCETVELVAVAKGWTTDFFDFIRVSRAQKELDANQEFSTPPPEEYTLLPRYHKTIHPCYFVLCVQWDNGVAKRQASGKVCADVWERNQEPVDLILG